jgi:uncharacterized linocin/CFP29 family protein
MLCNAQVPWTEDQWARVNQAIQEEAQRARVAATFLPLYGPLPADTDFVRKVEVSEAGPLEAADKQTILLATLQVQARLRGAQLADPELSSVLSVFRRAGNILARVEDALVFNGEAGAAPIAASLGVQIGDGDDSEGLVTVGTDVGPPVTDGDSLVVAIATAIGQLENDGHFGPFAVVLSQNFFGIAQQPDPERPQVTPHEQIVPLLGGGPLLRSSAIANGLGVVVALGGDPIDLVIARDMSLQFLQLTTDPIYVFRVYEKLVLRIKSEEAVVKLTGPAPAARSAPAPRSAHEPAPASTKPAPPAPASASTPPAAPAPAPTPPATSTPATAS